MNDLEVNRKKEIVEACKKLYENTSFKDINIKLIGDNVSVSRTSIYNYFQTKEEIFLELLQSEYELWNIDLKKIICDNQKLSSKELAHFLAESITKRINMLKLLAMNLYDIEENSRIELLTNFKVVFATSMSLIKECLRKFYNKISTREIENFVYSFFPFMYGIYPYTMVTDKQKEALAKAGANYKYMSIYDITYEMLIKLLIFEGEKK